MTKKEEMLTEVLRKNRENMLEIIREESPIAVAKKHFGDDDLGLEGDYERYL